METATKKRKDAPAASPKAKQVSPEAKRRPLETVRVGDCSASIWAREYPVQGAPKTFYSVTLERSYKDRNGAWKYTGSFDADSLGSVVSLCQQADDKIRGLQEAQAAD